jgi:hypothetical protein
MSLDALGQLNWIAVIVGGVLYFALGALWYSPMLFARPWQAAIGWDPDRASPAMNPMSYLVPLIGYVVMAAAVGLLAIATDTDTIAEGVVLGLVVGIGLSLMHAFVSATFDPNLKQKWTWFGITGTYNLIGMLIVAILVAVWR